MRLWVLSNERIGRIHMGPASRVLAMCRHAMEAGHEVNLVAASWEGPPPEWKIAGSLDGVLLDWRPGDLLVVDAYLPGHFLWKLVQSGIPYDLDLYYLAVAEMSAKERCSSGSQTRKLRFRWSLRYAMLVAKARKVYVSSREQISALGAMLFSSAWSFRFPELDGLPGKCFVLPMGVPSHPGTELASPYPADLENRGVILWGGGVWPWLDTDTVLDAFALLSEPDNSPALYFISSGNNRGFDADSPIRSAIAKAESKGLLGRNVHVNSRGVPSSEVPAYVEHCWAGILANPDSWEAAISWRTRFLDLLSAGRPLLVAGHDPLGDLMARNDAALQVESGDARGLAEAVRAISESPTRNRMGESSRRLGESMAWERILRSWTDSLRDLAPVRSKRRDLRYWALRHILGV